MLAVSGSNNDPYVTLYPQNSSLNTVTYVKLLAVALLVRKFKVPAFSQCLSEQQTRVSGFLASYFFSILSIINIEEYLRLNVVHAKFIYSRKKILGKHKYRNSMALFQARFEISRKDDCFHDFVLLMWIHDTGFQV